MQPSIQSYCDVALLMLISQDDTILVDAHKLVFDVIPEKDLLQEQHRLNVQIPERQKLMILEVRVLDLVSMKFLPRLDVFEDIIIFDFL